MSMHGRNTHWKNLARKRAKPCDLVRHRAKSYDKRTREQRKADEAMLFAGICLLLAAVLIAVSAMM